MKRGFTLVELSIVLVIIGLLIGGILSAQSMISTAKLMAFTGQMQQVDIATANFKGRFKGLPGDSKLYSATGDGDGLIEDSAGSTGNFDGEIGLFWPHLQSSGFDSGTAYTSTVTGTIGTDGSNRNILATKYGKCGIVAAMDYSLSGKNLYYLSDYSRSPAVMDNVQDCFTPVEALAYDTKVDDGNPLTGIVIAYDYTGGTCLSSGRYDVASSARKCSLSVQMLTQFGY